MREKAEMLLDTLISANVVIEEKSVVVVWCFSIYVFLLL
jgi:hypothetical protein